MSSTNAMNEAACPELREGAERASFTSDATANATLRAFVTATGDLAKVAARAEEEVGKACQGMANDLGLPKPTPAPTENPVAAICGSVSNRMDAIIKAAGSEQLRAEYDPPKCDVRSDAEATCSAQCSGTVDPGFVLAHCEPGHLSGTCEGTCAGSCKGACNGECQGDCESAGKIPPTSPSPSGKCSGQCRGTCRGTCAGECHGSCSVDFREPRCDVPVKAPSADAHCSGSCKAHADLTAQCTEPKVKVDASVKTGDMEKLLETLRSHLPVLLRAEAAYGERIRGDVHALVQAAHELPRAFGQTTGRAMACLGAATNACVSAQASLQVSVRASTSIAAKAGAHG
jgi:hypothetical protein